ncbi:MAG: hypothetical protein A3H71_00830 [Candidatus Sungbacteria bacterium RIFCSPLOWO2_02_FULL_48_13b]|uniref:Uncharacterized protein n=1 Tax=Candidatus Sungbacteria bacterium RIFCSPLOWO2_02_FULL_48_13b TaxID=1802283 RepID=A0A1G2LH81_9BACT|nr:MAG: hypothetical protein A3H71_00830 [Candidatus Sungbacteria bacterium RIFCSPLOWO2_02_FULL_48_13b]
MSIVDILVFLGAGAMAGAAIASYLKRDARGFKLLVQAFNVVAFYRCFGKRSEGAVECKLKELKSELQDALDHRDKVRAIWRLRKYDTKNLGSGPMRVT